MVPQKVGSASWYGSRRFPIIEPAIGVKMNYLNIPKFWATIRANLVSCAQVDSFRQARMFDFLQKQ